MSLEQITLMDTYGRYKKLGFALEMFCPLFFGSNVIVRKYVVENCSLASALATGLEVSFDFYHLFLKSLLVVNNPSDSSQLLSYILHIDQRHRLRAQYFHQPERHTPKRWLQPSKLLKLVAVLGYIHPRFVPMRSKIRAIHEAIWPSKGILGDDISSQSRECVNQIYAGTRPLQSTKARD